jgi:hypothetical protein
MERFDVIEQGNTIGPFATAGEAIAYAVGRVQGWHLAKYAWALVQIDPDTAVRVEFAIHTCSCKHCDANGKAFTSITVVR